LAQTENAARDAAAKSYARALWLHPAHLGALCNLGNLLAIQGDAAGAANCFRRALAIDPAIADALYNLANALRDEGGVAAAVRFYKRALRLDPGLADALYNLGNVLQDQGEIQEAIFCYERALSGRPKHPESLYNLALALQAAGRREEALLRLREAAGSQPVHPDIFFCNLGVAFNSAGLIDEAVVSFERALTAVADNPDALNNFGITLASMGRFSEAIGKFKRVLVLSPSAKHGYTNFGNALKSIGALGEAAANYERALLCDPSYATAHSNRLFTLLYREAVGLAQILDEARGWDRAQASRPARPHVARPKANPVPRVGFISADFRVHAVAHLVAPAIEALARRGHAFVLYHNSAADDEMTDRFRAVAACWRSVHRLTDQRLAEIIEEDGIDILIDLSGHSGDNRLPALTRKPAPIQMTWAGYPATTGLEAIDYLLADRHQVPDAELPFYQEKVIRLPDSYICYAPLASAPPVAAPPCDRNGFITFGSFNENSKISRTAVAVWARILSAVTGSRMLLKSPRFTDEAARDHYAGWFAEEGIRLDRLDFVGATSPEDHMAWMSKADITLDSFPYTGGLTTLETLWMGVPVVTLPGQGIFARHASGYLHVAGLSEWVARDTDDYVSIAVGLAADRQRLAALRRGIRQRLSESPLCDIERFANHFESMLRYIWTRHLGGEAPAAADICLPEEQAGYSF
jgi:predicted O-linked N-acetylglucosamine transferase (SPINDLY family)